MPRKRQRSVASKPETLSSSPSKTRKMMPKATLATAPKQSRLKEKKAEEEQPKRATRSPLKEKKAEEGQSTAPKRSRLREKNLEKEEPEEVFLDAEEEDTNSVDEVGAKMGTDNGVCRSDTREKGKEKRGSGKTKKISTLEKAREEDETPARFVGNQIPNAEARKNWPHRYADKINNKTSTSKSSNSLDDSEEIIKARFHYKRALVDGIIYNLYDDAHVQASDGEADYICRIIEMFESEDRTPHFTAQWYYRSTDTIIKDKYIMDPKCVFYSEIRNDNPLECLTRKLKIVRLALNVDSETRREKTLNCDFYCDMLYLLPYSTFVKLPSENNTTAPESSSTISSDIDAAGVKYECDEVSETSGPRKSEVALLDLYSGCGAMSTGLCLGANLSGINLVTKWAVDLNKHACESLRLNHSETQVRNESAEDFLMLLKEWEKLCIRFSLVKNDDPEKQQPYCFDMDDEDEDEDDDDGGDDVSGDEDDSEVFEVEKILEVCYGDPKEIGGQRDFYFKINNKTSTSKSSNSLDDSEEIIKARFHYKRALVDGIIYNLYDDAHVQASDGEADYICRIIEMFESEDRTPHFTAQWYYRSTDTIIKDKYIMDPKCVFYSEIRNDNPLECLTRKLKIVRLALNVDSETRREKTLNCDFYCDMLYLLPYSTFVKLPSENNTTAPESSSTISSDIDAAGVKYECDEVSETSGPRKSEVALLDLYSGCGAMSTGLCLGANLSGINLVTKWAVDLNKHACESLRLNHSETQVRNESAEDFLMLLKEWEKLCIRFSLVKNDDPAKQQPYCFDMDDEDEDEDEDEDDDGGDEDDSEVFEVEKILEVCYGDPKEIGGHRDFYFKVSWKNYGPNYDTWEPISGMSNCREVIKKFVMNGYKSNMLPLPGDVEVICGGPPCQGISGFNRFRNVKNPLEDPKNKQLVVFMDIVDFLKPKFVLMENVVDLLKFADGFLGRYAVGCLVSMKYQARLGMLAAGAYGLPQFRMRVFLWGACATEKLPQYPLPTHDVLVRGIVPLEFEGNTVAYEEGVKPELERKLFLQDAISDLPAVANDEKRNEMPYGESPKTEFQRMIRLKKMGLELNDLLFDHRPLELNEDDYQRVCRIPKKKGGNFRDLPGVRVRPDKKVEWDPEVPRQYLSSGKPLVPDYAMTFVNGSSSKPFARLWWDETVPTVVTRAEPHNQAIMHPEQDRVLTIRENARLQGFPDYYQLCGPIKERYIQVGNAVAVPVARALGYALGRAFQGLAGDDPVFNLPKKFPRITEDPSSSSEAQC